MKQLTKLMEEMKQGVYRDTLKDIYIDESVLEYQKGRYVKAIESFEEFQNSSIIYDPNQISILGYAQYENRTKYLEDLKNKTKELIKIIKASEANK